MNNNMHDHMELWEEAGFVPIDKKYISARAPKVKWGEIYSRWPEDKKVEYLEKLAASQNEAAARIMAERDELNKLCALKEEQLTKMEKQVRVNNDMLQQQVTAMNQERQDYNAQLMQLSVELKAAKKELRDH